MAVVADIANAIRDGKLGKRSRDLLRRAGAPRRARSPRAWASSSTEQNRMARLRDSVDAANRRLAHH